MAVYQTADFEQLVRGFAANALGGYFSDKIGVLYDGGKGLPYLVHKALHGLNGGLGGFIANGERGIGPGAFGGAVGEIIAEMVVSPEEQLRMLRDVRTGAMTQAQYEHQIDLAMNISRAGTVIAASLCGMSDADQLYQVLESCNLAIENNLAGLLAVAILLGGYIYLTGKEVLDAFNRGGWEEVYKVCQIELHEIMVYENCMNGSPPILQAAAIPVGATKQIVYKVGKFLFKDADDVYAYIIKSFPKLGQISSKTDFLNFVVGKKPIANLPNVRLFAENQVPYNPRSMEAMLYETYGAENITSSTLPKMNMPNVRMAGREICLVTKNGLGFKVVFNERGFPILDPFAVFDTKISLDTIALGKRSLDFKAATSNLRNSINSGEINSSIFNTDQINAIMRGAEKIPDYTWHHHETLARMQLIPSEIHNHDLLKHVGGFSMAH